jgi:hypothetical protein
MGISANPPPVLTPPAGDAANAVLTGQFAISGVSQVSPIFQCIGAFNIAAGGASGPNGVWGGSIQIERSFDGGTTWYVCMIGGTTPAIYSTANTDISVVVGEPERGVCYRLHAPTITGGVVNYRFSTTGTAATAFGIL